VIEFKRIQNIQHNKTTHYNVCYGTEIQVFKNFNCFLYLQLDSTAVNFNGYFVPSNLVPRVSVSDRCSKSCILDKNSDGT
jgi:hypothetical protein